MKIDINKIKTNPNNPRYIKDHRYKKLLKSIKDFPEMLEKRPIVVDENYVVLGGNMRLKACKEAGLKEVDVLVADDWSEKQKKEFIIKDNVGFGDWDYDTLANEWDALQIDEWGLEIAGFEDIDFDDIEDNKDRETKDKTKEVTCPECGNNFSC